MSAVIEEELVQESVQTPATDAELLARLMSVAGEVAGRTVLAVGSARLAALLAEAGASKVGASEVQADAEGVTTHDGAFPQLTFTKDYDLVLVAAGFEQERDALPRIARACGAAKQEVLAWFPQPARSWFGKRRPAQDDETFHEPAWVKRLFEMAGATSSERLKAPEGFIIRARFDG
jgi:hypothetical protein